MTSPVLNIADVKLMDRGHGQRFAVKWGRMGPAIGLMGLGCALHVVAPGKRAFPFHAHHVADEMFVILSGEGEYRYGDEIFPVRAGDVIGAPAGPRAHQLINSGGAELRYLGISTIGSADVVEYPELRKVRGFRGHQEWRSQVRGLQAYRPGRRSAGLLGRRSALRRGKLGAGRA